MYQTLFNQFLSSHDTLRVYGNDKLLFASVRDGLLPLMEYIDKSTGTVRQPVVIFDKVMGNAAALLAVKLNCQEVYSPLGSQIAVETLQRYGIKYHITSLVPCIQQDNGEDMCPMEKLSLDKEPEEFYQAMGDIARQKGEKHG